MAKRTTNIRRRGKSWVVYYRRDGRQVWRSFKTKEEAELELARAMVRKAQDAPEPSARRMTLAEHAGEWLEKKRGRVGEQTFVNYASVLNVHVLPSLGHLELRRVNRKSLDDFVTDWSQGGPMFEDRVRLAQERERARAAEEGRPVRPIRLGRSAKTISNAIVVLSAMFKDAVRWDRLAASPASALERPKDVRASEELMHPLDAAGIRALVEAADSTGARALLVTAAMTGMRRGELLGLRWRDVDYTNRRVWVRRSIGLAGAVQKPKTAKSVRAIALPKMVADALEEHWKEAPFCAPDHYVFASSTGTPLDGRNMVREVFEPARRRAKLPRVRFHDLRHSYASILIAQGAHPKVISEQLGHASVQITMDRYSHLFDRAYSDVNDELERAWDSVAKTDEAASGPASTEAQNGSAGVRTDAAAPDEMPAREAA
jgi:integrase